MQSDYKAVVVGAGPIGAALALSLAKTLAGTLAKTERSEPYRILLIDASEKVPRYDFETPDSKIFALNAGSQSLLDELGAWSAISKARCNPYQRMHVWDAMGTGSIEFDAAEVDKPQLGYIVEANLVQTALLDEIEASEYIDVLRPDKVIEARQENGGMLLQLSSGQTLTTELLCAADGAKSELRTLLNIDTREEQIGQRAIVANVSHTLPHDDCAWQIFHPTGPLAFLPMENYGNKPLSSIVWSLDNDQADALMALSDEEFERSLTRAIEGKFGDVSLVTARISFPLAQRHALKYSEPGFVLVGDAAHSIHPLAGLGANIGFQDVWALSIEIARATERQVSWGDEKVLRRYQRARQLENEATLQAMKGFKTLFGTSQSAIGSLRNIGLKLADKSAVIKRQFIKRAMMLDDRVG